jgi:hypothetical protein
MTHQNNHDQNHDHKQRTAQIVQGKAPSVVDATLSSAWTTSSLSSEAAATSWPQNGGMLGSPMLRPEYAANLACFAGFHFPLDVVLPLGSLAAAIAAFVMAFTAASVDAVFRWSWSLWCSFCTNAVTIAFNADWWSRSWTRSSGVNRLCCRPLGGLGESISFMVRPVLFLYLRCDAV